LIGGALFVFGLYLSELKTAKVQLFSAKSRNFRKKPAKVQLIFCEMGQISTRVALTFQTIFQINNLLNLQIIGWFSCTKIKKSPNVELIQRLSINLSTKGDFYG